MCGEYRLCEGTKWVYVHEYYPVVSTIDFPFQVKGYFDVAVKQGWINVISTSEFTVTKEQWRKVSTTESLKHLKVFVECDIFIVEFNGKKYKVRFNKHDNFFKDYEVVDDV